MSMPPGRLREFALALPEALESSHGGRPDFRVCNKVFATLTPRQNVAMAKLTSEQQEMLCAAEPAMFAPVPGGWGLRGATHLRLEVLDERSLAGALLMAWRNVAPKRLVRERGEEARLRIEAMVEGVPHRSTIRRPARCRIRKARPDEACSISRLIVRTVTETNSRDYAPAAIEGLVAEVTAHKVARRMEERLVYVALVSGKLIGTASLSPERVNSVFVDPSYQGRGIGTKLMAFIEKMALRQRRSSLTLFSSLTAVSFYRARGYEGHERLFRHGIETVLMTKPLIT
ncbi:MAG: GNAT family N-acetyltransferase [Hyphomicrobiales bacterium]|nr:GNAT family N-acetyltransferase [Hyphomicrobiales bacterium]MBV9433591.1 GNAT family N-acetyltransferase [Hyphomicrobiales bacterium]